MKLNIQRLFVGNLPTNVTEEDIKCKFAEYGNIQSTEIKKRPDGSAFAYINLEADRRHIDECLQNIPNKTWSGHNVKVELAKESFLTRLARERKEQQCETEQNKALVGHVSIENLKKEPRDIDGSNFQITGHNPDKQTRIKLETKDIISDDKLRKKRKSREPFASSSSSFPVTDNNPAKQTRVKLESEDTVSDENLGKKRKFRNSILDDSKSQTTGYSPAKQTRVKLETRESFSDEEMFNKKLPMFRGITKYLMEYDISEHSEPQNDAKFSSNTDESNKVSRNENLNLDSIHYNQNYTQPYKKRFKNYNHENYKEQMSDLKFSDGTQIGNKSTDSIRSIISENKRLKSIEEKKKSFNNQLQTVKRALSAVDAPLNKKIVFSDDEIQDNGFDNKRNCDSEEKKVTDRTSFLFNDESSEDESDVFKIKTQFEGRKGQKLLELQSRYANDKRFTLDEKFYESDEDEVAQDSQNADQYADEKTRQLSILQDVLGDKIHISLHKKEKHGNNSIMLRFDPLKEEHKRFEVQKHSIAEETLGDTKNKSTEKVSKKLKNKNDMPKDTEPPKVEVSKEKFYTVTDRLKDTLKNKYDNQFSLLEMFGSSGRDEGEPSAVEKYEHLEKSKKKQIGWQRNPFKYDSSDSEDDESTQQAGKPEKKTSESCPLGTNTVSRKFFFFTENDARLKDGLYFLMNAKKMGEEEFVKKRRELKQIIRSKIKNNLRKKKPWKKKLGGQKKKRNIK